MPRLQETGQGLATESPWRTSPRPRRGLPAPPVPPAPLHQLLGDVDRHPPQQQRRGARGLKIVVKCIIQLFSAPPVKNEVKPPFFQLRHLLVTPVCSPTATKDAFSSSVPSINQRTPALNRAELTAPKTPSTFFP